MSELYPVITKTLSFSEEIKKSRFITYLAHVDSKQAALTYLQEIKTLHKDARHHCWAYVAAGPKDSVLMGCSDDGEPKGTAGKPMMALLQGCHIGEIMAVVVRYSGGIKLGTGGLVRAYSNGIQQLLPQVETVEKRFYQQYQVDCDYAQMAQLEGLLVNSVGRIVQINYLQSVDAIIEIDLQQVDLFIKQLESLTQGKVRVNKIIPEKS
ncbi:YigZ family protein [Psychromonas sp. Urea-02u-13]|uniref:YigZ family protein n=1 Tax=Psychromonas sp. Urea-02u-13 TaxID=2058326 RepID=UPI000C34F407|nr:YigZ family protein [Psychromonas sp. Urea-02u-13]PKG40706.1 YigZ family protein [Psychromonas sp. Urea-02u-13]